MAKKTPSFEKNVDRLEEIVSKLSAEKVELDDAMKLYQEGMALGAECLKKVNGIEKEVQQLVEKDGELFSRTFEKGE